MIIEYRDVNIDLGNRHILENINLEVNEGDFIYLKGRVGSGKSTVLKSFYGEVAISSGTAHVLGFNMRKLKFSSLPKLRRQLGVVFQDFQLMSDRSVYQNLDFVLRATGWNKSKEREKRIDEVLSLVNLEISTNTRPYELSGGEQQRVCIARALLNSPKLILADEPTGNLDSESAYQVTAILHDIATNNQTSVIISTHNESLLEDFPGKVLNVQNNHITQSE